MADFLIVDGEVITVPADCETDPAKRAAFIAKALKAAAPPPPPAAEEK